MKILMLRPPPSRWLLASICCVPLAGAEPDPVAAVEKAAAEWVRVRAESTRLESEWGSQQPLLESMVNSLGERAKTLEARRDYLQAKTAKDRDDLARLEAGNHAAADSIVQVETRLKAVDARLLALRPALPPRLSAALDLPYRSLAAKELPASERMQHTMTVLNRTVLFNHTITCEEELVAPDGRAPQLLEVIYWGLSHGYALDRAAGRAWFGAPGAGGWHWEPAPDAAPAVVRLIAVYRSKEEPEFVAVPARLKSIVNAAAPASQP